jgi:hypothetical protein
MIYPIACSSRRACVDAAIARLTRLRVTKLRARRPEVVAGLPTTGTETPSSLLWFTTIQGIESKQDLAGLAPKDCFIPAKPVERVAGQIGQAICAAASPREVKGRTGDQGTCRPPDRAVGTRAGLGRLCPRTR